MKLQKIKGYDGYYLSEKGNMFKKIKLGSTKKLIKVSKLPVKQVIKKRKSITYHDFVNWNGENVKVRCDPNLYLDLKEFKKRQKEKLDTCLPFVGPVGAGKSTLAHSTIGPIMDHNFNINKIFFCGKDLIEGSKYVEDGSCLILDESDKDAAGIRVQSPEHKALVTFLTTCRSRRFTIILILPEFFKLSSYIALNRSNAMLYTYLLSKTYKRGQGLFWDKRLKRQLYLKGKKDLNYHCSAANYRFRFYKNDGIIDVEGYEKAKLDFFTAKSPKNIPPEDKNKDRDMIIYNLRKKKDMTFKEIANIVSMSDNGVGKVYKKLLNDPKFLEEYAKNT